MAMKERMSLVAAKTVAQQIADARGRFGEKARISVTDVVLTEAVARLYQEVERTAGADELADTLAGAQAEIRTLQNQNRALRAGLTKLAKKGGKDAGVLIAEIENEQI